VHIACKTAIKCEQSVGKVAKFDDAIKERDKARQDRDNADGMLMESRRHVVKGQELCAQKDTKIMALTIENKTLKKERDDQLSPLVAGAVGAGVALLLRWAVVELIFSGAKS
jgi:hypothetical protein